MTFNEVKELAFRNYPESKGVDMSEVNEFWTYEDAYHCIEFMEIDQLQNGQAEVRFYRGNELTNTRQMDLGTLEYTIAGKYFPNSLHMRNSNESTQEPKEEKRENKMTNKEITKEIRNVLKEKEIKGVTVRKDSDQITVTIRKAGVKKEMVQDVLRTFELVNVIYADGLDPEEIEEQVETPAVSKMETTVTATSYIEYLDGFGKKVNPAKVEEFKEKLKKIQSASFNEDYALLRDQAVSLAAEILPDLRTENEYLKDIISDLKLALSMYETAAGYIEKSGQQLYNKNTNETEGGKMKKTPETKRVSRKPIRIRLADNRDDWLEQRKKGIGGSDAANIIGMGYSSPLTTFLDKTGQLPPVADNLPMKLGRALEQTVADLFEEETGIKCRKSGYMFQSKQHSFMLANIDRLTADGTFLECKTTTEWNKKKIAFKGEIPAHWYCQCMHYMAVLGTPYCYLAVLIGNREFVWFKIERDEDDIKALIQAESDFWKMVQAGKFTGDPAGTTGESQSLSAAYPDPKPAGISYFSDEFEIRLREAEKAANEADEEAKKAKAELESVKNEIKLIMGDEATEFRSGNAICTWKAKETPRIDSKALRKAHPEIADKFTKVSRTREFRYKFMKGDEK